MTDDIDIPEKPDVETYEHVPTQVDDHIQFTFQVVEARGGAIKWTAEWDDKERVGYSDELSEKHRAIMYPRSPKIGGEPTKGSKLDDDLYAALKADLEAMQDYAEAKREAERQAERAKDLTLTVKEIEYTVGHRTKYTRRARVLDPNKRERHRTDEESEIVAALRRELGEADGRPLAEGEGNPFDDVAAGEPFAVPELREQVDGLDDAVDAIVADREREQARQELRNDHPVLYGVTFDPDDVRAALDEASAAGERVPALSTTGECADDSRECSLDRVAFVATPDGEIDVERTHTY